MNISESKHSYIGSLHLSLQICTGISVGVILKVGKSKGMSMYNFDIMPSINVTLIVSQMVDFLNNPFKGYL